MLSLGANTSPSATSPNIEDKVVKMEIELATMKEQIHILILDRTL